MQEGREVQGKSKKRLKMLSIYYCFQFMSQSLDILSSNLPDDKFTFTLEAFQDGQLALMKKKGVYPYDYMDNFKKFKENKLPSKEDFYSLLRDDDISDEEYQHAQEVWGAFRIENMGEYHDLHL